MQIKLKHRDLKLEIRDIPPAVALLAFLAALGFILWLGWV